jgi:hypothetical protein
LWSFLVGIWNIWMDGLSEEEWGSMKLKEKMAAEVFEDVTNEFHELCSSLKPGEMVRANGFELSKAIS